MRHEFIIYWSREDQTFLAEVPELPGCMADGDFYQETFANAGMVIAEWIETAPHRISIKRTANIENNTHPI